MNEEVKTMSIDAYSIKRAIYLGVKRAFDFIVSLIGLILLIPLMLLVKINIQNV